MRNWVDLVEFEVHPVITSQEAAQRVAQKGGAWCGLTMRSAAPVIRRRYARAALHVVANLRPQSFIVCMEEDPSWNPLVPELTVADLEKSLQFYMTAGLSVRFRRDAPPFASLELGRAQLMLEQEHAGGWNVEPLQRPLGRGINFQIEVPDVEQVLAALHSHGVQAFRGIQDSWYTVSVLQQKGQREFLVQDPDGYLLRFAQPLGSRSAA